MTAARSSADGSHRMPRIIWRYPYERLRMSSDDGQRLLFLDFGGDDGAQVSHLQMNINKLIEYIFTIIVFNKVFKLFNLNLDY